MRVKGEKKRSEIILRLYREGKCTATIAKKFSLPESVIVQVLEQNGITHWNC